MSEPSEETTDGPSPSEIPVKPISLDQTAQAAKKKLKVLAKTPDENLRTDIVQAIGAANENIETQRSIRLYTVASYIVKLGLGIIGAWKLDILGGILRDLGIALP